MPQKVDVVTLAGGTDYQGLPLATVVRQLERWADLLAEEQVELGALIPRVREALEHVDADLADGSWSDHHVSLRHDRPLLYDANVRAVGFIDRFHRVEADFRRLVVELPQLVTTAHLTLIRTVEDRLREARAVLSQIEEPWAEDRRSLTDEVAVHCGQPLWDLLDLSNVRARLETFVGVTATDDPMSVVAERALTAQHAGHRKLLHAGRRRLNSLQVAVLVELRMSGLTQPQFVDLRCYQIVDGLRVVKPGYPGCVKTLGNWLRKERDELV